MLSAYTPLARQFAALGARLVVAPLHVRRHPRLIVTRDGPQPEPGRTFDLDIRRDRGGEHFRLAVGPGTPALRVLHTNRLNRHLLLHAAGYEGGDRFLCGHDERHWFVAAIEGRVSSITEAKRALLPAQLREAHITPDDLARRSTAIFKRQGEWFFMPTSRDLTGCPILHQEPLIRGRGSKPHIVSEIVRFGGIPVMIYRGQEFTPNEWETRCKSEPELRGRAQRLMKDPEVFARGSVRHPDHATLILPDWHFVLPNREARSINVSFYD